MATVEDILKGIPAEVQEEIVKDRELWDIMQDAIAINDTIKAPNEYTEYDSGFPLQYFSLQEVPIHLMVIPKSGLETRCGSFLRKQPAYRALMNSAGFQYYFDETEMAEDLATLLLLPEGAPIPENVVDDNLLEEFIPEFTRDTMNKAITKNYIVYYEVTNEE